MTDIALYRQLGNSHEAERLATSMGRFDDSVDPLGNLRNVSARVVYLGPRGSTVLVVLCACAAICRGLGYWSDIPPYSRQVRQASRYLL